MEAPEVKGGDERKGGWERREGRGKGERGVGWKEDQRRDFFGWLD